jgi:hypothetical protein
MEVAMKKLTLFGGLAAVALTSTQTLAGTPIMDDPLPISVRGETSGNNFKAKPRNDETAPGYKAYRDRLGHGLLTTHTPKAPTAAKAPPSVQDNVATRMIVALALVSAFASSPAPAQPDKAWP